MGMGDVYTNAIPLEMGNVYKDAIPMGMDGNSGDAGEANQQ